MTATYRQMIDFLAQLGLEDVGHTNKSYLAHLIGVYNDLRGWGCDEELCRAGMFHSIYGTQKFQGFTLPLERREELRQMIGARGERLAYWNCAMYRPSFDAAVSQAHGPYRIQDRINGAEVELTPAELEDLARVHLCDWLEQVPRCREWGYRREAYRAMAERLGGVALASYEQVFAQESTAVPGRAQS